MEISKLKNQKYFITNLELKGFKGTKEIDDENGITKIDISSDLVSSEIILIFAENGKGKSTILENLHAHPFMISRDIKKSIEYPAYKKITFQNKKYKIECKIFWESEKETKGYIYVNDKILQQTEKGNITEYKYIVDKLFLEFNKFKTSLFMEQDVLAIVKAKPAERAKIINDFSYPTVSYEEIKAKAVQKINLIKSEIAIYEKDIENYKGYENRYEELQKFSEKEEKEKLDNLKKLQEELLDFFKVLEEKKRLNTYKNNELLKILKELSYIDIEREKEKVIKIIKNLNLEKEKISKLNIVDNTNKIIILKEKISKLKIYLETLNGIKFDKIISSNQEDKINNEIIELEEIIENYKHISYLIKSFEETKQIEKTHIEAIMEKKQTIEDYKTSFKIEEVSEELKIKYIKNQELISNLISSRNIIKEVINENKEKEKKLKIQLTNHIKSLDIEDAIKKTEIKIYELNQARKEKEELEKILENTEESGNDYKCKCCKSILNKKSIEEHILEYNNVLKNEKIIKDKLSSLKNELKETQKLEKELEKIKNLIIVKEEEISHKKYDNLQEKKIKTEQAILEISKIIKLKTKLEEEQKGLSKSKDMTIKQLTELNKYKENITEKIKKEKLENYQDKLQKHKNQIKIIEIIKFLKLEDVSNDETIKKTLLESIRKKEIELKEEEHQVTEYKKIMESINVLNSDKILSEQKIKLSEELKEKKVLLESEIKKINFSEEEHIKVENQLKETKIKYEISSQNFLTFKKDKEFIEKLMEEFLIKSKKIEDLEKEEFIYKKIKIYSDRIKKAQVSNFFAGITETINEMIATEEGSLSDLRVSITQKGNKNLNIETRTKLNKAEDIGLLSGAEKSVVSRGISLALAKEHNFGIVYIDESDGGLDKKNRTQFFQTLKKTQTIVGTNQLFVISHNEDLLLLADQIIDFK